MLFKSKHPILAVLCASIITACGGSGANNTPSPKDPNNQKGPSATNNTDTKYLLFSQKNTNQLMAYNTPDGDSKSSPFIKLDLYTKENAADLLDLTANITAVLSGKELSFVGFEKENKPKFLNLKVQNVSAIQKNKVPGFTLLSVLIEGKTKLYRTSHLDLNTTDEPVKQQSISEVTYNNITQPENQTSPAIVLNVADEQASLAAFFIGDEIRIYKDGKAAKTLSCKNPQGVVTAGEQFAVKCDSKYHFYAFLRGEESEGSEGDEGGESSRNGAEPDSGDKHAFSPMGNGIIKVVDDGQSFSLLGINNKDTYKYSVDYEKAAGFKYEKIAMENIGSATLCDVVVGKGRTKDHRLTLDNSVHAYVFKEYMFEGDKQARFKLPKMKSCNAMHATSAEFAFYVVDNATRHLYHLDTHIDIAYHVHNYLPYTNDINQIHDIAYVSFAKKVKDGE